MEKRAVSAQKRNRLHGSTRYGPPGTRGVIPWPRRAKVESKCCESIMCMWFKVKRQTRKHARRTTSINFEFDLVFPVFLSRLWKVCFRHFVVIRSIAATALPPLQDL